MLRRLTLRNRVKLERPKRALLIGINYNNGPKDLQLKFPQDDMREVRRLLKETFGFQDEDITILSDEIEAIEQGTSLPATRDNIMRTVEEFIIRGQNNTDYTLFFSGHSVQLPEPSSRDPIEGDGFIEFIIPVDAKEDMQGEYLPNSVIYDTYLYDNIIVPLEQTEGCHLLAVMDACTTLLSLPHDRCNRVMGTTISVLRAVRHYIVDDFLAPIRDSFFRKKTNLPAVRECNGLCPRVPTQKSIGICISTSQDSELVLEHESSTLTSAIVEFFEENPKASAKDVMSVVNKGREASEGWWTNITSKFERGKRASALARWNPHVSSSEPLDANAPLMHSNTNAHNLDRMHPVWERLQQSIVALTSYRSGFRMGRQLIGTTKPVHLEDSIYPQPPISASPSSDPSHANIPGGYYRTMPSPFESTQGGAANQYQQTARPSPPGSATQKSIQVAEDRSLNSHLLSPNAYVQHAQSPQQSLAQGLVAGCHMVHVHPPVMNVALPSTSTAPLVPRTSPGANAAIAISSNEGLYGDGLVPNHSAMYTQGHVQTEAEECTSGTLFAFVFAPLNISHILASKGPKVELLLVGAGIQNGEFVLGAAFDWDLIPNGVMIEEAHILTRRELQVDDQTRSDLPVDKLGLLLSPHRALIFTPSNKYYSTPYLDEKQCAYQHLIEFHNLQRLNHDYDHLVLSPLADQDESGTNKAGSSGVEFPRDSSSSGGNGSQREEEDSTGPPDDLSQEKGGGQGDDNGGDDGDSEGETLTGTPDSKVHFKVVFKVLNIQTIRVEGSLSSKDTADVLLPHDMVSACDFRFLELDFEGSSDYGDMRAHRQFYANVNIDVGERPFHVGDPKPKSTPRQSNIMEQVKGQESSKCIQASGALKSLGSLLPSFDISAGGSRSTKQGSSQKVLVNMNRIKQGQTETGAHWGYLVDDPSTAENGLRLTSNPSDLPSATVTFLGKEQGLTPPKGLNVKIDSYWTMPEAVISDGWLRWSRGKQPILKDLCVRIRFDIAPHLKGSWTLFREVRVGEMGTKDQYVFGITKATDVEFTNPSFPLAEAARQDPHNYAISRT